MTLDGELTAQRAGHVREALFEAINNADFLVINLKDVTAADMFCMQMFCIGCYIARKCGKNMVITGVRQDICKPGADEHRLNCVFSPSADNICKGGWADLQGDCANSRLLGAASASI